MDTGIAADSVSCSTGLARPVEHPIDAALTRGFSPTISRGLQAGPSLYQVQPLLGYLCRTPGR